MSSSHSVHLSQKDISCVAASRFSRTAYELVVFIVLTNVHSSVCCVCGYVVVTFVLVELFCSHCCCYVMILIKILTEGQLCIAWFMQICKMESFSCCTMHVKLLVKIKDVRSQRGGGFVQCGHFANKGEEGFFRCGHLPFLAKKTSDFSKFMVCQQGRRLSQCGHFSNKDGMGQFFAILCGRLL